MKNNILKINEFRNNPEFYFSKGLRFANKKNLSEAYRNLMKALELEPDNSEYKFNMACFLCELQRPREANRMFNDILINFDPTMFDCFFGLGCNSFEEGNNEKAAEYFDKYLYFDADGEFSYEISEMSFYLKLYSEISHDNKFLKLSKDNLRKAEKYSLQDNNEKAISYLYKSVIGNPMNVEARNQLTLLLMEEKQFIRAGYINNTVNIINDEDIWGNCLNIYLLSQSKKKAALKRALELLPYRPIENREELLCIATTLIAFNKTAELVHFIETYMVEYRDLLIHSILLLGYVITDNIQKAQELKEILSLFTQDNSNYITWLSIITDESKSQTIKDFYMDHYIEIFSLNNEADNHRYHPSRYRRLIGKFSENKPQLPKRYAPIIEETVCNREIMYSKFYKKEIIEIFIKVLDGLSEPIQVENINCSKYSAALEYLYCKLYSIEIKKGEIVKKYNVTTEEINNAINKLNIPF